MGTTMGPLKRMAECLAGRQEANVSVVKGSNLS